MLFYENIVFSSLAFYMIRKVFFYVCMLRFHARMEDCLLKGMFDTWGIFQGWKRELHMSPMSFPMLIRLCYKNDSYHQVLSGQL